MLISTINLQLLAKLFHGFADESRLSILKAILDGPKTVSEIVKLTKLSQPNTSAHLACLTGCGLVKGEKKGRRTYYRITMKEIIDVLSQSGKILQKHSKEIYKCTRY